VIALRVLGIVVALLAMGFTAYRYNRGRMRRLDMIVAWLISLAVVALGIYPDLFAPVFDALNFTEGNNRRLLGVLVISNVLLFLLYLRATALADAAHRDLQQLVRALAQRQFDPEAHPELRQASVVVIIPAYNESATIGEVLRNLPREVAGLRVAPLVVDDGSSDGTAEIAREQGAVVVHPINRGQGAALLTGYELAARAGAKVIAITDADGQTVPEELERLLQNRHSMTPMRREHTEIRRLVAEYLRLKQVTRDAKHSLGKAVALRRVVFQLYTLLKIHIGEEELYIHIIDREAAAEAAEAMAAALEHHAVAGSEG